MTRLPDAEAPRPASGSSAGTRSATTSGFDDILWRRSSDGAVAGWTMNGKSFSGSTLVGSTSTRWKVAGVGDYANDGTPDDILWHRPSDGQMALWTMRGTTIASTQSFARVSPNWRVAAVGDFEGDGRVDDILFRRSSDGAIALWTMDGKTQSNSELIGATSTRWKLVAVGDYEGNGRVDDILWRRSDDGAIALWTMDGKNRTDSRLMGTTSSNWRIAGTGDYQGSGNVDDIVWRREADGATALWTMDGPTRLDSELIKTASARWSVVATGDFSAGAVSGVVVETRVSNTTISADNTVTVSLAVNMSNYADPLEGFQLSVDWASDVAELVEGSVIAGPDLAPGDFVDANLRVPGDLQLVGVAVESGQGWSDDFVQLAEFRLRGVGSGTTNIGLSDLLFSVNGAQRLSRDIAVGSAAGELTVQ